MEVGKNNVESHLGQPQLFRRETVSGKKLFLCLLLEVFIDPRVFPEGSSSQTECPGCGGLEMILLAQCLTRRTAADW